MTERAPRIRVQRRPVHGVLLLDKPLGLSSNDALQKVKWLLRAEKAGHTGTLDPLASGVLPLCFGAATKFSQLQLDAPKTYEAVALLGVTTATGDAEGDVLERRDVLNPKINAGEAKIAPRHAERVAEAKQRLAADTEEELARLTALQAVNPSVRNSELDALRHRREQGLAMLDKAALRLEAIRVLVAG